MGEYNKDSTQSGTGKEQQGDKPAFGQFEKGQQSQEESGGQKGEDTGQGKQQSGQQFGGDKTQTGQKGEDLTGAQSGQQQNENKGQRQQGDEDLDEDSKSSPDSQGMK
jgi:hypothetical protein